MSAVRIRTIKKKVAKPCVSFGQSTHPLRRKLIDYSKSNEESKHIKTYIIKHSLGDVYYNINLRKIEIKACNIVDAYVIMYDYLNMNLKTESPSDKYEELMKKLIDEDMLDAEGNFANMSMLQLYEDGLYDDDLWIEEIQDCQPFMTLTFVDDNI